MEWSAKIPRRTYTKVSASLATFFVASVLRGVGLRIQAPERAAGAGQINVLLIRQT
jgi:hypothetical protein